jgi:hypothetical protein
MLETVPIRHICWFLKFRSMLPFVAALLLNTNISYSATSDTTKVGVYITSIYDLDYQNSAFSVEFWMWRLNTDPTIREFYTFEPTNSKKHDKTFTSTTWEDQTDNMVIRKTDTLFWDYENFKSVFKHQYDINRYPFDEELLVMEFEGDTYYDNWVNLQIDQKESKQNKIEINGWDIGQMQIEKFETRYETSFGSPGDTTKHTYSGFRVSIPIHRKAPFLFVKLFTGLLVSFIIALYSLKINISEADGRFGVCVGALFAALANMYIVNSNLPLVSQFTFMDNLHILTIMLILGLFIASTFSLKFYKAKKLRRSLRLDIITFRGAILIYTLSTVVLIIKAMI